MTKEAMVIYNDLGHEIDILLVKMRSDRDYYFSMTDPKEVFEYFKANCATVQLLIHQQFFIQNYGSWNLPAIEEEIIRLENRRNKGFKNSVTAEQMKHPFFGVSYQKESEKDELFIKLNGSYYENERIDPTCHM